MALRVLENGGRWAAACVAAWLLGACATPSATFKFDLGAGPPPPLRLIAVYPVALRFEAPAYRSYELAMDEVFAVLANGHFMALGPSEFGVLNWESGALYAATTLSGRLTPLGLRPENAAALRGWIERREQQGSQELYDRDGKPKGRGHSVEITYLLHVELIGPESQTPLAEGSLAVSSDPFAEHPASDDAPEVRAGLRALVTQLFEKIGSRFSLEPQVSRAPLELDWAPWDEERFALPHRPALREQLLGLDPVAVEASKLLRLAYFLPEAPADRQGALLASPAGLYARRVPDTLRDLGWQPGDLIVQVEADAAVGPQTLLRWASAKPAGTPVSVKVQRLGQIVPLHFLSPSR